MLNGTNGRRNCGINLYNELYKTTYPPKNIDFLSKLRENCSFFLFQLIVILHIDDNSRDRTRSDK